MERAFQKVSGRSKTSATLEPECCVWGRNARAIGVSEAAEGTKPVKVVATLGGKRDPGYWDTSRMLLESALCLALQVPSPVACFDSGLFSSPHGFTRPDHSGSVARWHHLQEGRAKCRESSECFISRSCTALIG